MSESFPGIGIAGYRSFGADMQWIELGEFVTVILGVNNSGKSNVLRALEVLVRPAMSNAAVGNGGFEIDKYLDFNHESDSSSIRVALPLSQERAEAILQPASKVASGAVSRLLEGFAEASGSTTPHIVMELKRDGQNFQIPTTFYDTVTSSAGLSARDLSDISTELTNSSDSGPYKNIGRITDLLRGCLIDFPETIQVPALRFIREGSATAVPSGEGYVEAVKKLRGPQAGDLQSQLLYDRLCNGLQLLLDFSNVEILVPEGSSEIHVRKGNGTIRPQLPLSSFGTGTEHAFIILLAALTNPNKLVCIEEPELHIHPRLQRQLVSAISELASGQVIITTHSSSFVDLPGASHIRADTVNGSTMLVSASDQSLFEAVRNLGSKPSDLLQSNYIIWVEGPSDRIYVNHWISLVASDLREGIHYSIAFSAGSLVKYLTADNHKNDLIDLRRLNRSFSIVADRDRTSGDQPLKEPITRLQAELIEDPDAIWVTNGPTIESYIPEATMLKAVQMVHPTVIGIAPGDWDVLTRLERGSGRLLKTPLKVDIALEAVKHFAAVSDLGAASDPTMKLVERIRTANS